MKNLTLKPYRDRLDDAEVLLRNLEDIADAATIIEDIVVYTKDHNSGPWACDADNFLAGLAKVATYITTGAFNPEEGSLYQWLCDAIDCDCCPGNGDDARAYVADQDHLTEDQRAELSDLLGVE